MIYSIDLGTTYSIISSPTGYSSGLVPSIADLSTGKAGWDFKDNFQELTVRSYKRDISKTNNISKTASACVLNHLKELALTADNKPLGTTIQAVIAVPAYFDVERKEATIEAANRVGIEVVSLITEPTAAALTQATDNETSVIYDLGGGTFDISVVRNDGGNLTVLTTKGMFIGGTDLDAAIADYVMKKCHISPLAIDNEAKFLDGISQLKIARQKTPSDITVTRYICGQEIALEAIEYDYLVKKVFGVTVDLLLNTINDLHLKDNSYKLIPVGGSTKCPYLLKYLEEATRVSIGKRDFDPDFSVAEGARIYADALQNGTAKQLLQRQAPNIYLKLGEKLLPLIAGQASLPANNIITLRNVTNMSELNIVTDADNIKTICTLKYNKPLNTSNLFALEIEVSVTNNVKMVLYQMGNERMEYNVCLSEVK